MKARKQTKPVSDKLIDELLERHGGTSEGVKRSIGRRRWTKRSGNLRISRVSGVSIRPWRGYGGSIGTSHSLLLLSGGSAQGSLYDQCGAVTAHECAQDHQDAQIVSGRRGGIQTTLSSFDEAGKEVEDGAALEKDAELLGNTLRRTDPRSRRDDVWTLIFQWRQKDMSAARRLHRIGDTCLWRYPTMTRQVSCPRRRLPPLNKKPPVSLLLNVCRQVLILLRARVFFPHGCLAAG